MVTPRTKDETLRVASEAVESARRQGMRWSENLASAVLEAVGFFRLEEQRSTLLAACREAMKWPEEDEFGNAIDEEYATPGYRAFRKMLRTAVAAAEAS